MVFVVMVRKLKNITDLNGFLTTKYYLVDDSYFLQDLGKNDFKLRTLFCYSNRVTL